MTLDPAPGHEETDRIPWPDQPWSPWPRTYTFAVHPRSASDGTVRFASGPNGHAVLVLAGGAVFIVLGLFWTREVLAGRGVADHPLEWLLSGLLALFGVYVCGHVIVPLTHRRTITFDGSGRVEVVRRRLNAAQRATYTVDAVEFATAELFSKHSRAGAWRGDTLALVLRTPGGVELLAVERRSQIECLAREITDLTALPVVAGSRRVRLMNGLN